MNSNTAINDAIEEIDELVRNLDNNSIDFITNKINHFGLIVAQEIGLFGFQDVCMMVSEYIYDLFTHRENDKNANSDVLKQWVALTRDYIKLPDQHNVEKILNYLQLD